MKNFSVAGNIYKCMQREKDMGFYGEEKIQIKDVVEWVAWLQVEVNHKS